MDDALPPSPHAACMVLRNLSDADSENVFSPKSAARETSVRTSHASSWLSAFTVNKLDTLRRPPISFGPAKVSHRRATSSLPLFDFSKFLM